MSYQNVSGYPNPPAYQQSETVLDGYPVVIEWLDDNYGASSPVLVGAVAAGESFQEVLQNMREVIALHIEGMREDGIPVPPPQPQSPAQPHSLPRERVRLKDGAIALKRNPDQLGQGSLLHSSL